MSTQTTLPVIPHRAMSAPHALNEATDYELPSSFSRGMRVETPGVTTLYISGTASIGENGETLNPYEFEPQCWRTFRNIQALLEAEGASWKHIVRTTCYIKDIQKHYDLFNKIRTAYFTQQELDPIPASTGIEVRLCRDDLLIEIEAIAMFPNPDWDPSMWLKNG
jgi:2-iminobutanoate/2-iminopropanoate deaminase